MEEQKNNQQEEKKDKAQTSPASGSENDKRQAQKQDGPHKKHGLPEDEEEGSRHGGLKGAENFRKNMGCGG